MANFLRFRKRSDGAHVLVNMDHVVSIEAGSPQNDEGEWSKLHYIADGGGFGAFEVMMSIDELAGMLAGVWEKDAD